MKFLEQCLEDRQSSINSVTLNIKLWFGPNTNSVLLETLKFRILITVCALNNSSTDKIRVFMYRYRW